MVFTEINGPGLYPVTYSVQSLSAFLRADQSSSTFSFQGMRSTIVGISFPVLIHTKEQSHDDSIPIVSVNFTLAYLLDVYEVKQNKWSTISELSLYPEKKDHAQIQTKRRCWLETR